MIHNAPAVVYPLGRSRFLRQLLVGLWLAGLLLALFFAWTTWRFDWRSGAVFAAVLGAGVSAYLGWRHQPSGQLRWDGAVWRWESASYQTGGVEQEVLVIADFQSCLLLRLKNPARVCLWLWLEKRTFPARWLALRRAIYSSPKSSAAANDVLPLSATVAASLPGLASRLFPTDSSNTKA